MCYAVCCKSYVLFAVILLIIKFKVYIVTAQLFTVWVAQSTAQVVGILVLPQKLVWPIEFEFDADI